MLILSLIALMMAQSISLWQALHPNFDLGWNLFLAFIPFVLSLILFQNPRNRSWVWWFGIGIFILFLPNAPYTLTDIVHFFAKLRYYPFLSYWLIGLLMIEFGLYFFIGFQFYVLSLMNLNTYLQQTTIRRYIVGIELLINALCAIGIYLGRFQRFNSWDLFVVPTQVLRQTLENFLSYSAIKVMLVIFLIITFLYYILKAINRLVVKI